MNDSLVECTAECVPCNGEDHTRNWYAWVNAMPGAPRSFHVTGEICVGNPGIVPELVLSAAQPISPTRVHLDLYLVQRPGAWPRVFCWKPTHFMQSRVVEDPKEVVVFHEGKEIAKVGVDVVV